MKDNAPITAAGRMDGPPRRKVKGLLRDRSAAAAVEFALIILPFLSFILIIMQVALYHFGMQSLDFATRLAARQIMIGQIPAGAQSANGFKTSLICPKLLMNFTCANVVVNAYKVSATSDAATNTGIYQFINSVSKEVATTPSQKTFCTGGPGDYVFLDISYQFPNLLGGILSASNASTEGYLMRSSAFFRNEPFSGAASAC